MLHVFLKNRFMSLDQWCSRPFSLYMCMDLILTIYKYNSITLMIFIVILYWTSYIHSPFYISLLTRQIHWNFQYSVLLIHSWQRKNNLFVLLIGLMMKLHWVCPWSDVWDWLSIAVIVLVHNFDSCFTNPLINLYCHFIL